MEQFILNEKIQKYEAALRQTGLDGHQRKEVLAMLYAARRELALLLGASEGALPGLTPYCAASGRGLLREIQAQFDDGVTPTLLLDPSPGLHIVDVNESYSRATMLDTPKVVGRPMFEVFPDNPEDGEATGVSNLFASLQRAAGSGKVQEMAIQRYDIRDSSGAFVERYWLPRNTPVFDGEGRLRFLAHQVEEVTDRVLDSAGRAQWLLRTAGGRGAAFPLPEPGHEVLTAYLRRAYGLTKTEAEIAAAAGSGLEIPQIARSLNISVACLQEPVAGIRAKMALPGMTAVAVTVARIWAGLNA